MTNHGVIQTVRTIHSYHDAFRQGQKVHVSNLCGRLIRGKVLSDFERLSDDPNREIVMLFGSDGLQRLIGRSGYEMLELLGHTPAHIAERVNAGYHYKLAVFEEYGDAWIEPATWENVTEMASYCYPLIRHELVSAVSILQEASFTSIEQLAGYRFADVDNAGISDERYMTYNRCLESHMDLLAIRAFYYFTLHLRELFSGDGYTYAYDGDRGVQEYIILNRSLKELGAYRLIDVPVELPM